MHTEPSRLSNEEIMATATPKAKHPTVERAKSSRKRSYKESSSAKQEHQKVDEKNDVEPKANKQKRKKQKNIRDSGTSDSKTTTKKPLAGMTISVSTLSDNTKSKNEEGQTNSSYNEVCQTCRALGATVIDLVCKRVNLLVCTEDAVKQATQRVRKAIKKKKPLLSVAWLNRCKDEGRRVEYEEYRLDTMAREYIQNREARLQSEQEGLDNEDTKIEAIPDAGWTEPQDLGCCCVCHENNTTADCPWCKDAPCNTNRVSEK